MKKINAILYMLAIAFMLMFVLTRISIVGLLACFFLGLASIMFLVMTLIKRNKGH